MRLPMPPNGIRLDWGFDESDEISFYYDPMIGKIISHDLVREDAIEKLISYLSKVQIQGIKTNIPFLISLLKNKNFMEGSHNTKYIENNLNSLISSISMNSQLNYNNDINPEKIKIIDTDKINIIRKQKRVSGNGEEMKVVFFD
jgi:acetyl-CoA carboxylase biotin carboxylase subunit